MYMRDNARTRRGKDAECLCACMRKHVRPIASARGSSGCIIHIYVQYALASFEVNAFAVDGDAGDEEERILAVRCVNGDIGTCFLSFQFSTGSRFEDSLFGTV